MQQIRKYICLILILIFYANNSYCQISEVKFGEDKTSVKNKLESIWGLPDIEQDDLLYYGNKTYLGFNWTFISYGFNFGIEGDSHLYNISWGRGYKTLSEAREFADSVKGKLKYDFQKDTTSNELPYSYKVEQGGKSLCILIYYDKTMYNPYLVGMVYEEDSEEKK